ncbi:MAG: TolC family protein [Gammaproteobacteria bacterium]|jgi:outer membrane protein TolC|nr:TolC family protein [Gammaproteobacteria bacterium]
MTRRGRGAQRLGLAFAAVVATACSVAPVQLTPQEIGARVRGDQEKIYTGQQPVTGPITYEEALARALKYNLDYRLKLMESALARGIADVSAYDMLPKLVANAGYVNRSNDSGGTSVSILTGEETLSPSTSEERQRWLAGADLSWNVLDFGLSYFRAKQAAEEYNIAEERRRRVQQNIVQDVRNAYWRALGAQRLLPRAESVAKRARVAVDQSRAAEAAGVLPPAQALAYQRALLDALTLVTLKRQELDFAKRELGALMNVAPGIDFELAEQAGAPLPPVPVNVAELELISLENRPELREEDYKARSGVYESRKQLLSLFPNLSLNVGPLYDSNKYLYNSSWWAGAARLSMNLLRLPATQDILSTNEARQKTDEARRLALSMAIMTQVRVAVERYRLAAADYQFADEAARVDQRLADISRAGVSTAVESELEAIRTEARALVSEFQRAASYAGAQTAYARIYNSLGLDVLPARLDDDGLEALAAKVKESLDQGERDSFFLSTSDVPQPQAVRLEIAVPAGMPAARIRSGVAQRLAGQLPLATGKGPAWRFQMRLVPKQGPEGLQRAEWQMTLRDPAGRVVHSATYQSALPGDPTERAVVAFAEAAALSQVGEVRRRITPAVAQADVPAVAGRAD